MASTLNFFKIANGELAIFNKFQYVESHQVNEVLKRSNSKLKTPNTLNSSGFQRINENRLTLIMDCGIPSIEKTKLRALCLLNFHTEMKRL